MTRNRLGVLCLLLLPVLGAAEEEKASFRDITLAMLGQLVGDIGAAHTQGLVEQIAEESGLDKTEVRGKLVELLDELEAQRKGKTEAWNGLVTTGGEDITEKKADKFLKELGKSLRKVLEKEGVYALDPLVKKAARKAKMPTYQGTDFLVMLLNPAEVMPPPELPDKIGLVVVGESKYAIDVTAFESILITSSDRLNQNKVRNVHKPIAEALIPELEGSGFVKWAVDKPDPKLTPDCRLDFEVDWFSTKARTGAALNLDPGAASDGSQSGSQDGGGGQESGQTPNALPKVYVNAHFIMTHLESGVIVFNKTKEFQYDFGTEPDDRVVGMRLLNNFYKKIAKEATREVNQFLAGG